jgi:glycosyltransferase involved in cell wall biosynthesis
MNYAGGVTKMSVVKKLFYSWEGSRVARYESHVLKNFHHFSVVSEVDKQYLLKQAGLVDSNVDFSVINHGAPISENAALRDAEKIFFIGSLDYEPNRDALSFFLKVMWEPVITSIPNVELLVLGGGHIPDSLKKYPQVRFTGFVPSVFETVTHCKALVAPIRFAGGTPSKIIEAMGYGIPVITTPSGAVGISGVVSDSNIFIVPESDTVAWVESIKQLFTNQGLSDRVSAQARALVREHYSAQAAQQRIKERFNEILGM